jgi:hypothetical protein
MQPLCRYGRRGRGICSLFSSAPSRRDVNHSVPDLILVRLVGRGRGLGDISMAWTSSSVSTSMSLSVLSVLSAFIP